MQTIKILDILPDIYSDGLEEEMKDRKHLKEQLLQQTKGLVHLESTCIAKGSDSIECFYDGALAVPYILKMAEQAECDGYNAILLDCFMDPGFGECRELLTTPVFGVCHSACNLAMRLGGEFSIIGILDDMDRCIKENIRKYGMSDMLVSTPVVDVPVLELYNNIDRTVEQMIKIGAEAVRADKAKALVLGCTGMSALVEPVKKGLLEEGIDVPVVEPLRSALYDAIGCVLQGVAHSKQAYCNVRPKRRILDW